MDRCESSVTSQMRLVAGLVVVALLVAMLRVGPALPFIKEAVRQKFIQA